MQDTTRPGPVVHSLQQALGAISDHAFANRQFARGALISKTDGPQSLNTPSINKRRD